MVPSRILYGLAVQADEPVAALSDLPLGPHCDVRWHFDAVPPGYEGIDESEWGDHRHVEEANVRSSHLPRRALYRLTYDDGTTFAIDATGTDVWAQSPPGATLEDTATYLLGPVMGFVLRLRGVTCLHASAVAVADQAIAFVGHAGSGKSTTAAMFARLGYSVLTDDVAPLAFRDGDIVVEPAYPRVRLWPESVASLFGSPDALPLITPNWEKRFLDLGSAQRFQGARLPLAAAYVLGERRAGAYRIERLDPSAALMALVERAYSTNLIDRAMRAREFDVVARVVERVPIMLLSAPEGMEGLEAQCREIAGRHTHVPL